MRAIAALSAIIVLLVSCSLGKQKCMRPQIGYLFIKNFDTLLDSSATIYKYRTGTAFGTLVDSTVLSFTNSNGALNYMFVDNNNGSAPYDYVINLYPVGTTHSIKNISFGGEKENLTGSDQCYTSIHYILDGLFYNSDVYTTDANNFIATISIFN